MTKKKQLVGTVITAGLISAALGVLALDHHRPEGALFLGLFAVVALAVAILYLAIIFGNSKRLVDGALAVHHHYRSGATATRPTDAPTIPLANPTTGLPLVRGACIDVGGNIYGQARSRR